jgi:hypothetical protein
MAYYCVVGRCLIISQASIHPSLFTGKEKIVAAAHHPEEEGIVKMLGYTGLWLSRSYEQHTLNK